MRQTPISCSIIRGGTSKGLYFLAGDLPAEPAQRDAVLLAALGSAAGDGRQIDGLGGGHPLTSKVAIVSGSQRADADVDYLFLQVWPDRLEVSDQQPCGNLLAGVGPFALESGLVQAADGTTQIRIWMENTSSLAVAEVQTPDRQVDYDGDARIDGVPGTAGAISLAFLDTAGSTCGALLPTGSASDVVAGVTVTCIDNGMPVVCLTASDVGLTGTEAPTEIEANSSACGLVESIRLKAGELMGLGDVRELTIPKVTLLAPPARGGAISTRTFIPRRVHSAIGVLGAVSVATACLVPGSVAGGVASLPASSIGPVELDIEHPSGFFTVSLELRTGEAELVVDRSALVRTARLLGRGEVYVPRSVWDPAVP